MSQNLPPRPLTLQEAGEQIAELRDRLAATWTVLTPLVRKMETLTDALMLVAVDADRPDVAAAAVRPDLKLVK
jgi:hypothetical protein